MRFRKIIRMFEDGNVCVTGLRGKGKDMLMSNVVVRRNLPYVSNVDYKGKRARFKPFRPLDYDTKNSYKDFIDGKLKEYTFPHEDGTDIYISDAGVYFPSQYCSELNKQYGGLVSFMALSRHLGKCNVHINVQNLNRCWDKIREQSDLYITCNKCIVFFGFVLQLVTIYEKYDSCVSRVPPFSMKKPVMNKDRMQQWEMAYNNYRCSYGKVERRILFYRNKSNYDTRIFKTMLSQAEIDRNALKDAVLLELANNIESGDYDTFFESIAKFISENNSEVISDEGKEQTTEEASSVL